MKGQGHSDVRKHFLPTTQDLTILNMTKYDSAVWTVWQLILLNIYRWLTIFCYLNNMF